MGINALWHDSTASPRGGVIETVAPSAMTAIHVHTSFPNPYSGVGLRLVSTAITVFVRHPSDDSKPISGFLGFKTLNIL